jgi:hypothetical protein
MPLVALDNTLGATLVGTIVNALYVNLVRRGTREMPILTSIPPIPALRFPRRKYVWDLDTSSV